MLAPKTRCAQMKTVEPLSEFVLLAEIETKVRDEVARTDACKTK